MGIGRTTAAECEAVLDTGGEVAGPGSIKRFGVHFIYASDEWYLVAGFGLCRPKKISTGLGARRKWLGQWWRNFLNGLA